MNRSDFQRLSRLRVKEAKVLLSKKCFEGAYYLLGYAVECAFKACIAKKTKRYDFPPDRKTINAIYTHELEPLVGASGLTIQHQEEVNKNRVFRDNWNIVRDWNEGSRYERRIAEPIVRNFFSAVLDETNGILPWLSKFW